MSTEYGQSIPEITAGEVRRQIRESLGIQPIPEASQALARFFYGHLLKRIGEKGSYTRNLLGFLKGYGLGYIAH